jgi:hypothetical protein
VLGTTQAGRAETKKTKHGENRANREGKENPFSIEISVNSVFSILKIFALFCTDFTINRIRQIFRQTENRSLFEAALNFKKFPNG